MNQQELETLVNDNKSIADISQIYGIGKSTTRYWLNKYGLISCAKRGAKNQHSIIIDGGIERKKCNSCNILKDVSSFRKILNRNNYSSYCKECESKNAILKQQNLKKKCIEYLGGECECCHQKFDEKIYQFHHTEPAHKDFNICKHKSFNFENVKSELDKCILLCANCHYRIHSHMKKQNGYFNKIKNNSELWNINKQRKLDFIGKSECSICGYDKLIGGLVISFPKNLDPNLREYFQKYNKTNWDQEFKTALKDATVYCRNCHVLHNNIKNNNSNKDFETELKDIVVDDENEDDNKNIINDSNNVYKKIIFYTKKITHKCKMCENFVTEHRNIYCSNECRANDNRRAELPSVNDLIDLLKSLNYTQVGKMYGVSDNAVRKWVKKYGYDPKTLTPIILKIKKQD